MIHSLTMTTHHRSISPPAGQGVWKTSHEDTWPQRPPSKYMTEKCSYVDHLIISHHLFPFPCLSGENMVPKQTIQIQEDNEERTLRAWGRPPSPPAAVLLLSLLPVGHQHGRQRRTSALWRIYEQFWTLVPRTPAGLHAKDSDDVTDRRTQEIQDKLMDLCQRADWGC